MSLLECNQHKFLISPCRFDLMAKFLYVKHHNIKTNTDFFIDLYKSHINTFNGCWEYPGTKVNIQEFIDEFNKLIENMKNNGFNKKYPIPIGTNGIIVNGSHRLMTSYFLNIDTYFKKADVVGEYMYNYSFFLNRKSHPSLKQIYADTMALEYIKHNKNLRCMIFYPVAYNVDKIDRIFNIIKNYGYIYYHKEIKLNKNGINNLIKEAYRGEKWIGGLFPQGFSPGGKAQLCVGDSPIIFCLVAMNDVSKCIELKEKCRNVFKLGKHSLHMSDYTNDTFRISASLLNKNSIDFLNNGTNDITPQTKMLLSNYFKKVGENNEDFCLTSSLIMEMYGLRQVKDIDYLHKNDKKLLQEKIDVHTGKWLTYYHKHKDEIIYNPMYHFYFNGFKFAALEVIKRMKENRNEQKDIVDINLINKCQ